jgi:hypothetical protein
MSKHNQYAEGYQAGMQDISDALDRDGVEGVRQWLYNNHLANNRTREQVEWITEMRETPERPR